VRAALRARGELESVPVSSAADEGSLERPQHSIGGFARIAAGFFLLVFLAALSALGYVALYGLRSAPVPPRSSFAIPLDELRQLAHSIPGTRPRRVVAQVVASEIQPRGSVIAGESWREPFERAYSVFSIEFESGSWLVDASMSARTPPKVRPRLDTLLLQAQRILFTHLHSDHLAGVLQSPRRSEFAPKLALTDRQLAAARAGGRFPADLLQQVTPLAGDRALPVAPGVVLLPAPGNTPESQLVFVQLSDGRELLLIGDVVWSMENLRLLRGRPHAIAGLILGEDEVRVADQLRALHDLLAVPPEPSTAPEVVPSHDLARLRELVESGDLAAGLWPESSGVESEPQR